MNTALLVDGQNLMRRSLFGQTRLTRSDGQEVGAAQSFLQAIVALVERHRPVGGAVVFDGPGRSHRRLMSDEYKGARESADDDASALWQRAAMRHAVRALGFAVIDSAPYEADDVIATLATRRNGHCVIASDDKDLQHLTHLPNTIVHQFRDWAVLDARAVRARWGVAPHDIPRVQTLCGDLGDGAAGLRGVGRAQARVLTEQYGSAERALCAVPAWGGRRWIEWCAASVHARQMHAMVAPVTNARTSGGMRALRRDWPHGAASVYAALECRGSLARTCRKYGLAERTIAPLADIAVDHGVGVDPLPADIFA